MHNTIHRVFVSRQVQSEIIANILITRSDTQEEQPADQHTPAKKLVAGVKKEKARVMLLKPRPGIKQAYCAQSKYRKGRREGIKERDRLLCDPYLNSAGFSTQVLPPIDIQNIRTT